MARRRIPSLTWLSTRRSDSWPTGLGLESVDRGGTNRRPKVQAGGEAGSGWLFRVVQGRGDLILVPPATLKLDLRVAAALRVLPPLSPAAPGRKKVGSGRRRFMVGGASTGRRGGAGVHAG